MKCLTVSDIKKLIKEGYDKYLILQYAEKNGKAFLVHRDNPRNVVGQIRRSALFSFNTQLCSKPIVYYEFQSPEFVEDRI